MYRIYLTKEGGAQLSGLHLFFICIILIVAERFVLFVGIQISF